MKRATREGFQVSIGLHLAAIGVVLVLGLLATFFEEESLVVFELVDLSGASGAVESVSIQQPQAELLPEPEPLPPVESLEVPTFDDLRPVPDLPPERIVEPTPVVAPTPAPEPPQQRLSYADHVNQFGQPEVTQAAPQRRAPDVRIETNARDQLNTLSVPSLTSSSVSMSATQVNALNSYVDSLAARLQAAFNPLGTNGLEALVEFTVQADGTISPFRIKRTSGNEAFDRSVLNVFQRLRRYNQPPDGKSHTWEINFRSVE